MLEEAIMQYGHTATHLAQGAAVMRKDKRLSSK